MTNSFGQGLDERLDARIDAIFDAAVGQFDEITERDQIEKLEARAKKAEAQANMYRELYFKMLDHYEPIRKSEGRKKWEYAYMAYATPDEPAR